MTVKRDSALFLIIDTLHFNKHEAPIYCFFPICYNMLKEVLFRAQVLLLASIHNSIFTRHYRNYYFVCFQVKTIITYKL